MVQLRNRPSRYLFEVDERELSLISRGLALLSGEAIQPKTKDSDAARELNVRILHVREARARQEVKTVEDAFQNLRH